MADKTGIEWTDATWNPVTGCTEVSPGCDHCYAKTFAERWRGTPRHYFERGFDVQLRPDKLEIPLRWRRPRRIFVNSMSDLFHDDIPTWFIGQVWDIMARCPQHTFQILTKRHARMRSVVKQFTSDTQPLPNVWLGVSAENQQWADIRIPALINTPAAVRWVSAEPLLGPIDLLGDSENIGPAIGREGYQTWTDFGWEYDYNDQVLIDWVVVGGESGRGARPMQPDWTRSLRDQCIKAGVPFLFKQWGEWMPTTDVTQELGGSTHIRMGKKHSGRYLDGRTWDQYPETVTANG